MYRDASSWDDAVLDAHEQRQRQEEVYCWFEHEIGQHDCNGYFLNWLAYLLLAAKDYETRDDIPF